MNNQFVSPCQQWAEKLALLHSGDLSSADRAALEVHLTSCDVCAAVGEAYQTLDRCLHHALQREPAFQVSADLLHLENAAVQEEMTASVPFAHRMGGKKERLGSSAAWRTPLLLNVAVLCLVLLLVGVGPWGRSLWENTLHPVPHRPGLSERPTIDGYPNMLGIYTGTIQPQGCGSLDFTLSIEHQIRNLVSGTLRLISKNGTNEYGTVTGGVDTSGDVFLNFSVPTDMTGLLFYGGSNGGSPSSGAFWGTFRGTVDTIRMQILCQLSGDSGRSGAWIMHRVDR